MISVEVRRDTDEELVQNYTDTVPVDGLAVRSVLEDLGREIRMRANEGSALVEVLGDLFRQAEVGQLDVAFSINENILWLEVAV